MTPMKGREEIIEAGRELDAGTLGSSAGANRYYGTEDPELAAAIDIISAHGCADELTGELEHGPRGARIGRYVLWSDPQRVAALQTFANVRDASMMLELGGLYLAGNTERRPDGVRVGTCCGATTTGRNSRRYNPTRTSGAPWERSCSACPAPPGEGYDQSPSGAFTCGLPPGAGAGNSHGGRRGVWGV
jgi:hypothetical protein